MNKQPLRSIFLERRKDLDPDSTHRKSKAIANSFFEQMVLNGDETIHVFLPILKNNEVDTWAIINRLKVKYPEVTIVAPVTNFKTKEMVSMIIETGTSIKINKYGIPEPQDGTVINNSEIDIVITPLLAVDKKNYRVGYGGGYYDRFFTTCKKDVQKIGIGFFDPIPSITDVNEFDIMLDKYIYE